MQDFKLCNVLLEANERANDYPDLYCRTNCPIPFDEGKDAFELFPYAKYDFATYFNAFSNTKWRRYTMIDNVGLRLNLMGDYQLTITRLDATLAKPKRSVLASFRKKTEEFEAFEYKFDAAADNAEFLSFEIVAYGPCFLKNGYFFTQVEESCIREVNLALATTTFKQEKFIIPTIELFKKEIVKSGESVADHFRMHVIDNGRTLDAAALSGDGVIVHPNKNVGGAGGFARGMIEALRQDSVATHVLLMDDDVQISSESIIRTFNILSLVNEEYEKAFVSGAMISYERQDELYEDVGWVRFDGMYGPIKKKMDISNIEKVVECDTLAVRKPNRYAGWWYCCIPASVIKEKGLPLPLFIRGDDAEYGNRAADRFITMNGVCVWHLTLALKYRAAFERYQVPRNSLIAQATTGVYSEVDFMAQFTHNVQLDFKTFNYDSVELSLDALEDYLKGPEFIMQDQGERLLVEHSKKNEVLADLDDISDSRIKKLVIDPTTMFDSSERTFFEKSVDYLFYNGHRLPNFFLKDGLAVIPWDGWLYPAKKIRMHKEILAVSIDGKQGIIRTMDKPRFRQLLKRYKHDMRRYKSEGTEVAQRYAAACGTLTSEEFWKKYLEID
ncbi:MAG: glycosyltransferase [Raoultibacter sp.]